MIRSTAKKLNLTV